MGPLPGELYPETNDNSVALLLTCGTTRVLLAGDAEAREEYMAGRTRVRLRWPTSQDHILALPRFCVRLAHQATEVELALL